MMTLKVKPPHMRVGMRTWASAKECRPIVFRTRDALVGTRRAGLSTISRTDKLGRVWVLSDAYVAPDRNRAKILRDDRCYTCGTALTPTNAAYCDFHDQTCDECDATILTHPHGRTA